MESPAFTRKIHHFLGDCLNLHNAAFLPHLLIVVHDFVLQPDLEVGAVSTHSSGGKDSINTFQQWQG